MENQTGKTGLRRYSVTPLFESALRRDQEPRRGKLFIIEHFKRHAEDTGRGMDVGIGMFSGAFFMKQGFILGRARPVAQHSCPVCMSVFRGSAGVRTRLFHRIACRAHRVARIRIGLTEGGNDYTHAQNRPRHYQFPSNNLPYGFHVSALYYAALNRNGTCKARHALFVADWRLV